MIRIRELRKAAGLSQHSLAKTLGVTQGAISQWEQGWTHPSYKALRKLTESLGVTLNELYSEEDDDATADDQASR